MTVDLTKAHVGQIAHLRCGGKARITKIESANVYIEDFPYFRTAGGIYYHCLSTRKESMLDIIRLEEPPFDWKDVKPGMAFTHLGRSPLWYMADDPFSSNYVIVAQDRNGGNPCDPTCYARVILTRAPEHDITP